MENKTATLWDISLLPRAGYPHPLGDSLAGSVERLAPWLRSKFGSLPPRFEAHVGYLIQTAADRNLVARLAHELLADPLLETAHVEPAGVSKLLSTTLTIMRKPGVMDPPALSIRQAAKSLGVDTALIQSYLRIQFEPQTQPEVIKALVRNFFANDAIDQVLYGRLDPAELIRAPDSAEFVKITVPIRDKSDQELEKLSREGGLYLSLREMKAIRDHFDHLGRSPTDVELETIAQTWSEHCSHKTLKAPYTVNGRSSPNGILKDTIFRATKTLNRDWCVSVFEDNAGIIRFDDDWNVCFKVETHNHPSAIEPYGGANTGLGGVIRDILGAGMGAKPICSTDVFCVAPPNISHDALPPGVLHPERVLRGVVAGVRDYGNRMGIPTVNGAVWFDEAYLGNPLVFCGTVGIIPRDKSFKGAQPGDLIVSLGGRTGRDGIHGATFSSGELTHESETVSGGAVQIGNAIVEKKLADVLIRARDMNLFHAVTDCGAGGFSSAVGEMGAQIGARVNLEAAPLKYSGLTYCEIWISEAQERMVLAVPPENWETLRRLVESEDVEATVLGTFEPTGRLTLTYHGQVVADLSMQFLHDGRPSVVREGTCAPASHEPHRIAKPNGRAVPALGCDPERVLLDLLSSLTIASKEWIIRQYDHEVQGGSILKPLVGVQDDGPSDAAVVTPVLGSTRGLALGCGLNPEFGKLDPYKMAALAIDEAIRNVVAVGGDPRHLALLDNFCWGNTERPEIFGSLAQAAFACHDVALGYGVPFISGKDSLNNEFVAGETRIVIPPTLLISALAIVPDVRRCATMDFKRPGSAIILVGNTREEFGGSHFNLVTGSSGGSVPLVNVDFGKPAFLSIHELISSGVIRTCHDLSEGGLAVALAEMCFAGGFGAAIDLESVSADASVSPLARMFAESPSRFLIEVEPDRLETCRERLSGVPHSVIGAVTGETTLVVRLNGESILNAPIASLKQAWQRPLAWS